MSVKVCPGCQKEISMEGVAFCPYCGASLKGSAGKKSAPAPQKEALPPEAEKGLAELARLSDPKKKNRLMDELLKKYPSSLAVNEEKLFLVREMDFRAKTVDFSVIKSFLLNSYLTPEEFTAERNRALRKEIFSHPQLERCLELSGDPEAYTRHYLERLCTEFVNLFLHGSSLYTRSFLGFRNEHGLAKKLALPVAKMMKEIYRDQELTQHQQEELYRAMWIGLKAEVGNTSFLEELLTEYGLPLPTV